MLRLRASAVLGVLAATGIASITYVATHQQHAPQPPLSAAPAAVRTSNSPVTAARADTPVRAQQIVGPVLKASTPTAIAIPAIGVHSVLLDLGRTSTGALAVPLPGPNYNQAGWYTFSPSPGTLGPAVIAGHVDSEANGPSVFYRLGGVHPGALVSITRADHSVAIFRVDAVQRFHKAAFPTQLVYGNTDHAALRLITCGGAFDTATGHYLDNIVVSASLVRAEFPGRSG